MPNYQKFLLNLMYLKSLMSHLILKSLMSQLNQMNPKIGRAHV
jgi:hypothetical protein